MSFSVADFSTSLQTINATTESASRTAWGTAFRAYFAAAITSNGVSFTSSSIARALIASTMASAMTGLSTSGPAAVQAGIDAWWTAMVNSPGTYFSGATAVAKPSGLTSIASGMEASVFVPNRLEATKAAAMNRLATYLHGLNAGGTATIGGTPRTIT